MNFYDPCIGLMGRVCVYIVVIWFDSKVSIKVDYLLKLELELII